MLIVAGAAGLELTVRTGVSAGAVPAAPATPLSPITSPAAPSATAPPARVPVHLQLPAQGVDAPVIAVGVTADGVLGVPADSHVLGWWGAPPGATTGTTVIDGHVDSTAGPGALIHLAQTPIGATIRVLTNIETTVSYVVQARRSYLKADLPADVFDQTVQARLVLITCGGSFDSHTRHYDSNTVVYALPQ